ncbi:MAG: winged helix-turn-helix domain-containing protein [Agriterribacter sp.]
MRVNFVFTILVLAAFVVGTSFKKDSDLELRAKRVNLIIRQIGHQLLLQAGDSTSRVLPVTETKEGVFLLRFENEFGFSHDSLMVLSRGLLPKSQFPSGYTVTVQDCLKGDIVYGFQVNNSSPDILACAGRIEPRGCYTIEFAIADFYGNVKQPKAASVQPDNFFKIYPKPVASQPEVLKKEALPGDLLITTPSGQSSRLIYLVIGGGILLLGSALLIRRFGKKLKPEKKAPVTEPDALGKFLFNRKEQQLLLGSEVISLTDKEFKVLDLLHKHFGELIPRETLMQEVWINEGVITGRSLDMFVSKLRKKLSPDPELSITNVHGRGYKLEMRHPAGTLG